MIGIKQLLTVTTSGGATRQVRTMKDVQEVLEGTKSKYLLHAIRRLSTFMDMVDLSTIPADLEWINDEFPQAQRGVHPRPDLPSKLPAYKQWRADLIRAVSIATGERDAKNARKARVDGWTGVLEAIALHSSNGGILHSAAGSPVSTLADLCRTLNIEPWQLDDPEVFARIKDKMPAPLRNNVRKALAFLEKWRFLPELGEALTSGSIPQLEGVRETRRLPDNVEAFIDELVEVAANELDEVMGADSRRVSTSTIYRYRAALKHHFRTLTRCPDDQRVRYKSVKDLSSVNDCADLVALEHLKATIRQSELDQGTPGSIKETSVYDYYADIIVVLSRNDLIDGKGIKAIKSSSFLRKAKSKKRHMTEETENWCRKLITDTEREQHFRNLHRRSMNKAIALMASIKKKGREPNSREKKRICQYGIVAAASAIEYAGSPIRLSNVIALRFRGKTQNFFPPSGKRKTYSFEISGDETKAKKKIVNTSIREEAHGTTVLDWYFSDIRPLFSTATASNYLFPSPTSPDRHINKTSFDRMFQKVAQQCGIDMTFHKFRHGCATLLLKNHPDKMSSAAALLGNTIAVCEQNYGFIDDERVVDDGQKLLHQIAMEAAK